jgi:ATP-dependent DNA ligase
MGRFSGLSKKSWSPEQREGRLSKLIARVDGLLIMPCQPALSDRPPSGPGWLHEIKFDGYRVIARKDGEQVRLWARTTSDYSKAFTRIRDAVAALPVDSAVLDGEAVVMRPDNTSDFDCGRDKGKQRQFWSPTTSWKRTGRTCALSHWKSAGSG